ncbi:MAG: hypothetical protein M1827_004864 [Pycnora praestabilis]|nr:MAG: hypothetical protein M1827_004864 [Pycnora praestabilis]
MAANIIFWMSMIAMNDLQGPPINFSSTSKYPEQLQDSSMASRDNGKDEFESFGISKDTSDTLSEIRCLNQRPPLSADSSPAQEALSVLGRLCSILQRLLRPQQSSLNSPSVAALSKSCHFAATLYILFPLCGYFPDPTLMVNALVHRLKDSLGSVDTSDAARNPLLLWLLSVGGVAACRLPEHGWFIGHLVVLIGDLDIRSWWHMRGYLTRFVWHDVFCEDPFQILWEQIVIKRDDLLLTDPYVDQS